MTAPATPSPSPAAPAAPPQPSAAPLVNRENPWPGLASFDEQSAAFFFGRNDEAVELLRMVKRETLTVLSGQSGLGKTSLLQAGLFPRLRQEDFLPILVRLDHALSAPPLAEQVKSAIHREIIAAQIDGPVPHSGQSLWEYFHQKKHDFWSSRNRLLTPVIVFDQFEEIFTLGRGSEAARARGRALAGELADLIKNNTPDTLAGQIENDESRAADFVFDEVPVRVILSLREDFIGALKGLESQLGSILHNWMPLYPMTGAQAYAAIIGPGGKLVDEQVGQQIVRFVAGVAADSAGAPLSGIEMEGLRVAPSLLSVICRELNERRIRQGLPRITSDLVAGNRSEILDRFYERSMDGLPASARIWVEDSLLTPSGYRDSEALENAAAALTPPVLEKLISRRLLRIDDRGDSQRVELTHDILAAPVRASRDQRHQREELEKAAHREKEARQKLAAAHRRMEVLGVVAAIVLIFGVVSFIEWREASKSRRDAEMAKIDAESQRNDAQSAKARADEARNQAETEKINAQHQAELAKAAEAMAEKARADAETAKADAEKQRDLAQAAEKRASARFDDVKDFANEIIFDAYEKVIDIPGATDAANFMVNTSLGFLKKLNADAGDDPSVAREMLVAYNRLGMMAERLGNTADASSSYKLAMDIAQRLARIDPTKTQPRRDLAICYDHLGDIDIKTGRIRQALDQYQQAFEIWQALAAALPSHGSQQDLGVSYDLVGNAMGELGDTQGALENYRKSMEIYEDLVKAEPDDIMFQQNAAVAYEHIGRLLWRDNDNDHALEYYKKAFAINERLANADPSSAPRQRSLAISYDNIGDILSDQGDAKGALEQYQKSFEIWNRLANADRSNAQLQRDLAISFDHLGDMISKDENYKGALEQYSKSFEIRERLARTDPTNMGLQRDLAVEYSTLGGALSSDDRPKDALEQYKKALAIWDGLAALDPTKESIRDEIVTGCDHVGQMYLDTGDPASALPFFQRCLDIVSAQLKAAPDDRGLQREQAVVIGKIGTALELSGDKSAALEKYQQSLAIRQRLVDQQPDSARAKRDLQFMLDRIDNLKNPKTSPTTQPHPATTAPATTSAH